MNSRFIYFISFMLLSFGLFAGYIAFAQSQDDILYPIEELGNCANQEECKSYCDNPDNKTACLDFAEKHGLLSEDEIEKAKIVDAVKEGPGGCKSREECEGYCEDISNIEECLVFASENGLLSSKEIEEARAVAKALQEGAQLPGGCRTKEECDAYCEDSTHIGECLDFAEKAGLIPPEELQEARQVAAALEAGAQLPGGCRTKNECEAYCAEPTNMEACLNFAEQAGFISAEEAAEARKILPLMISGEMPGGCREKKECEAYCSEDANIEECAEFAAKAGFMTQEELEMFKKTGGKGPGDCKGKEECEAFCNDPANQETCFNFAKEHGLISEEELQKMQEGMSSLKEGLQNAPPEVTNCLRDSLGTETIEKIQAGTLLPGSQIGDQMRVCFEQFMPQQGPNGEGPMPPGAGGEGQMPPGFTGPGGCTSEEECRAFCSDSANQETCMNFGGSQGGEQMPQEFREEMGPREERHEMEGENRPPENMPVPFQGPGGCTSEEECKEQMMNQGFPQEQQEMQAPLQFQEQAPSAPQEQPQSQSILRKALRFMAQVLFIQD